MMTVSTAYMLRLKSYFRVGFGSVLREPLFRLRKVIRSYSIGKPCRKRRAICPICHDTTSQLQYKHREFRHTKVHICAKCGHGYADRDFVINRPSLWSTDRERADYYLSEVIPLWVKDLQGKKFLEIGSCDFYLLLKLKALYPELLLYAYDKYPKEASPEHITFINNLEDVRGVDYVLIIHTLEHVYELDTFLMELNKCLNNSAIVIIEVPNNSTMKHSDVRSGKHVTGYHFHFFNEWSLSEVLLRHNFEPLMIRSYGPHKWELNGINLLGVFQYVGH